MAYYCGECIVWRGSSDENKYGERWCSYSRRYERSDQNTYGCKGFLYVGRAVLTKVCETLGLDTQPWFAAFDRVKEEYLVPEQMGLLVQYCDAAPALVQAIDCDPKREALAQQLLETYLTPARSLSEGGRYEQAVNIYQKMVEFIKKHYRSSHKITEDQQCCFG